MALGELSGSQAGAGTVVRSQRPRHRPQWRKAFRSLRRLLAAPGQTQHAFEVIRALDGDSAERGLQRMLSQPQGRDLFLERPDLAKRLMDREALSRLPEGSFGRAYLEHLQDTQVVTQSYEVQSSLDEALAAFEEAERLITINDQRHWAPAAVDALSRRVAMRAVDISDQPWTEIDFPEDLIHARQDIWPLIESSMRLAGTWSAA